MLQGHVFDSFTRNELRPGGAFTFSQFVGGMPPAIFLFLTGVTLAFLMDSTERKGMAGGERVATAFRRSGYLFALALAFRVQLWLFGWPSPWQDLLRVDILNCMGFSIALLSSLALFRTSDRVRAAAGAGLGIALLSPVVSALPLGWIPELVRAYIVPDHRYFSFFPWGAYLAFGVSAGSLLRVVREEGTERVMQWAALAGGATIIACQYLSNLPYSIYTHADYWLNSPAQVLTKQGVTLVMLALAWLWTRHPRADNWSWVRQFGTTSLLVYWVHIELVYGRWFWFFKNSLTVPQTVAAAVAIILLMLAISTAKTYRRRIAATLGEMGWWPAPRPERVPGD
jgi:uncharacterized membrane protein